MLLGKIPDFFHNIRRALSCIVLTILVSIFSIFSCIDIFVENTPVSSTDKVKRIRFRFAYEESPLLIIIEKSSTDYLRVAQYSSVFRRGLVVVKPPPRYHTPSTLSAASRPRHTTNQRTLLGLLFLFCLSFLCLSLSLRARRRQ